MKMRYYDVNIVKYGNDYRVSYMVRSLNDELKLYDKQNKKIGDRYMSNISRAKNTILGYGKCNEWDYFVTFTLDPYKYNRFNLDAWRKDFAQYIRNMRRKTGYEIKYLLIPERHQDGAWHMHGLIAGLPWDSLEKFDPALHPLDLVRKGYRYSPGILKNLDLILLESLEIVMLQLLIA